MIKIIDSSFFICLTLLLPLAPAVGQWLPDHQVDPVVVTVDRYPGPLTQTARTVTVLQRAEIERLNARSLTNLLQAVPGVMLQKRGSGIQTDVSVRGGSFSETLILLDGVPVNDPQTGHHNLNLPVSIQDIQRIEVLHGPGSDVYGADAVSGVVHIVTRETKPGGSVQVRGGEHGLVGSSMALRTQTGRIRHSLSANYEQSDGFTRNTDYECLNVSWKSTFKQGDTRLSLYSGVSDKQFGANSFYSQQFPDQYEQTRAWLSSLRLSTTVPGGRANPLVYYRQHHDDFLLDRQRPDWYRNRHTSKSYGFSLPVHVQAPGGLATVKLQGRAELVTSSSLGDHIRQTYGASLSYRVQWSEQLSFTSSTFSHYYDQWGWQVWPGLSAAYRLTPHARIFASWGRAFRMPSFTELYYASPGNIGNPDLDASASSTLELGTRMYAENRMLQVSLFRRTGANIIDWVRAQPQDPWMVINHSKTRFTGLKWEARLNEPVLSLTVLSLRGIHLYANKTLFGFESKYALRYLRHHIRLYTDVAFRRNMHAGMAVHWKQPDYDNGYMLMNLQLYRTLGSWRLALSAENVTDTHYRDLPGVPTPGRWMRFNVSKYW